MPVATKKKKEPSKKRQRKRWIPDLKRYHRFKTSRSIYIPFDVPEGQTDEYSGRYTDPETVVYQVCIALSRMFGFSMNLISLDMKAFMLKVVTERTPHLCCSSLRAIMEGRVPGIPKPTSHDPMINHFARTTLMMMDVMDTIVCEYLREQEEGLSLLDGEPSKSDVEELGGSSDEHPAGKALMQSLKKPFPTMQEQLERKEREEHDAFKNKETSETDGRSVPLLEGQEEDEDSEEGSM